jgi:hypothetical protein
MSGDYVGKEDADERRIALLARYLEAYYTGEKTGDSNFDAATNPLDHARAIMAALDVECIQRSR